MLNVDDNAININPFHHSPKGWTGIWQVVLKQTRSTADLKVLARSVRKFTLQVRVIIRKYK